MNSKIYYAGIVIIGNEILSGKTQDLNINFLTKELQLIGIRVQEVRIVPDVEEMIIEAVTTLSKRYDYVFTTGGIGPTHDDITAEAIAKAFNRKLVLDPDAHQCLKECYEEKGQQLNESRLKMAYLPEGANLIANSVAIAPGFIIENVYVMAGIPRIAQAMFVEAKKSLKGGQLLKSEYIQTNLPEGLFAQILTKIQNNNPDVEIGSYPAVCQNKYYTSLVLRSIDEQRMKLVKQQIENMIIELNGEIIAVELSELS